MDRRRFLQLFGGGVVASATMAEAGFLADFMAWLKRKPVWSIPSKPKVLECTIKQYYDYVFISELAVSTAIDPFATIYWDRNATRRFNSSLVALD